MRSLVTAGRSLLTRVAEERCGVLIEGGRIVSISGIESIARPAPGQRDDFAEGTLCPAFLDIHIHGARGHDVMEADAEALQSVSRFLATRGVGAYYPTTVTAPIEVLLRSLSGLAKWVRQPDPEGAAPLGIHLEGPFISHAKRGVHPPAFIQKPSVALFDRFWEASEGQIRLMTVAPEMEGAAELIEYATRLGVRISLGHSDAGTAEAKQGIAAGAKSATHTFNAMRALDHRDPGILGTVLDTNMLFAELICDGVHVDPAIVRLFWKAVGIKRAVLVTDGMSATGMPDGEYMLGGLAVQVKDGRCLYEGRLAGSVLTLDRAVANFLRFTGASLAETVPLVTTNPATLTGVQEGQGALVEGSWATFNVLGPDGTLVAAYHKGVRLC